MTLIQIQTAISEIESELFLHSLTNKPIDELKLLERQIVECKKEFLNCSFTGAEVEVLEDIRFRIKESTLGIEMSLRAQRGLDYSIEIGQLQTLYQETLVN